MRAAEQQNSPVRHDPSRLRQSIQREVALRTLDKILTAWKGTVEKQP
jgi:hypothetical protein